MDKAARFYRGDLQVHIPRDTKWAGQDYMSDDKRRAYAAQLVLACRVGKVKRGLSGPWFARPTLVRSSPAVR